MSLWRIARKFQCSFWKVCSDIMSYMDGSTYAAGKLGNDSELCQRPHTNNTTSNVFLSTSITKLEVNSCNSKKKKEFNSILTSLFCLQAISYVVCGKYGRIRDKQYEYIQSPHAYFIIFRLVRFLPPRGPTYGSVLVAFAYPQSKRTN